MTATNGKRKWHLNGALRSMEKTANGHRSAQPIMQQAVT
jgi:hypothetical protein